MNEINVISPYLDNGVWVFDGPDKNLVKEALIAGIPEIIEHVCQNENIENYKNGFSVVFSKNPFPGHKVVLDHVKQDEYGSGNYYQLKGTDFIGWLCPALFKYFTEAPKQIYIDVKNK